MRVRSERAQALLELALFAPVVILLTLGTVACVQLAGARAGLDAATQAAGDAAARSPDQSTAVASALEHFTDVAAGYPLRSATLTVSMSGFRRGDHITAASSALIDLGWAPFLLLPTPVMLRSQVVVRLEPWRTHRPSA